MYWLHKRFIFLAALSCAGFKVFSQDSLYARKVITKLCSKEFAGRGYASNGCVKAGKYIAAEMKKAGLKPLPGQKSMLLPFKFPVNLVQESVVMINGKTLKEGVEYITDPAVGSIVANSNYQNIISEENLTNNEWLQKAREGLTMRDKKFYHTLWVMDTLSSKTATKFKKFIDSVKRQNSLFSLKTKLTYSVSTTQNEFFEFEILRNVFPQKLNSLCDINIVTKSRLMSTTQNNVAGYVKGTEKPDSFLVVTAHYDHLGKMGKAIFPGANDNAAGVAMMLDLARYFAQHPARYSLIFIGFAGEEAGLIGSQYYVKNAYHNLNNTRFLLNLDLVGTGEWNSTVVNATVFTKEFELLDTLNKQYKYVPGLNKRGKAANSDHYFFSERGIPAFFIYQSGPRPSYHDVYDVPETLTLSGYRKSEELYKLFLEKL